MSHELIFTKNADYYLGERQSKVGMCFKHDTGSIVITVNGLLQISEWVEILNVSAQNILSHLGEIVLLSRFASSSLINKLSLKL